MKTDKLKNLYKERDKLMYQLDRSLALQAIWPSIFKHGKASTRIEGNSHNRKLILISGNKKTQSYSLKRQKDIFLTDPTNKIVDEFIINHKPIGSIVERIKQNEFY